jgi:glycosyltransferase involved in cell wall biosynthesis
MPHKPKKPLNKWTVIIPAHNEGSQFNGISSPSNLRRVLKPLREWRDSHPNRENIRLLVVNDGSRDDTVRIAKEEGIELIHSDSKDSTHNMGKSDAVRAAARHARDVHKSDVFVTLDADIIDLKGDRIDELMEPILNEGYHMSVAKSSEGSQFSLPESGNRAFKLSALDPWIDGNLKWTAVRGGFGLEQGLNTLIPKSKQKFLSAGSLFSQKPAFRGSSRAAERQDKEVRATMRRIDDRKHPLYMAGKLRAEGKLKEARDYVANWHAKRGERSAYMKIREDKSK